LKNDRCTPSSRLSLAGSLLALILIFGVVPNALGNEASVGDPVDAFGRLDITRLLNSHVDADSVRHKVRMESRWRGKTLRGRNSYIHIWFSTDEDRFAERRVTVDFVDGSLKGLVEHYEEGEDYAEVALIRRVPISRPDRFTLAVAIKVEDLGDNLQEYWWSATSSFQQPKGLCASVCRDTAPQMGTGRARIHHDLTQ
jgi:hypothetical protein